MKKTTVIAILAFLFVGLSSCNREVIDTRFIYIQQHVDVLLIPRPIITIPIIYEYCHNPSNNRNARNIFTEFYTSYPIYEECHYPPPRRPMVALTFDDGPTRYTEYILDILERHGARATFCVLGNLVERREDTVRRAVELGNEVIGHSWNHANFTILSPDAIKRQIQDTSAAIEAATGVTPPPIFRAPYGNLNARVRNVAAELGYSMLNWTVDTEDWRHRDATIIYQRTMDRVIEGSIILLHDIRYPTKEAVELLVPSLIERGFQLVTVSELIEYVYGGLEPGREFRGLRPGERAGER